MNDNGFESHLVDQPHLQRYIWRDDKSSYKSIFCSYILVSEFKSIVKNYFLHVTVILTSVLCLGWNVKISYFKACASLLMIPLFIAYSRPWLFSKNLSDMILFWIRSSSVCHFVVFCIFLYKLFKLLFIHTLW